MSPELALILFVLVGLLSGLLGGLLGIGGGVITVPFLYYFYRSTGEYPETFMKIAICTSLAVAFITSGMSTHFQFRRKAIDFSILKWMSPFLAIGCVIGVFSAAHVATRALTLGFALIAAVFGIYFLFPQLPKLKIASKPNPSLMFFGLLIGTISSMLGIGGGLVTFPILLGYQVPLPRASGTSSAATLISTGVATFTFFLVASTFPGYIDLRAWSAMSIGSLLTARFGARLVTVLDVQLIKRIFGISLILIALSMYFL